MKNTCAKFAVVLVILLSDGLRAQESATDTAKEDNTFLNRIAGELEQKNTGDMQKAALHFQRGKYYLEKQQYDKGIADFDETLKINPNDGYAYTLRGNCHLAKHELDKAMSDYNEVLRVEPRNYKVMANRGLVHDAKGEYEKAAVSYTESIGINPNVAENFAQRANDYEALRQHDKALADYTESIRLDPKNAETYISRGDIRKNKGDHAAALEDFRTATQLDPKSDYAFNQVAWELATCPQAELRDGKKAVEYAQHAYDLQKSEPGYMDTLAAAYAESGDFASAVKYEEKFLAEPGLPSNFVTWGTERLALYKAGKAFHEKK